MSTTGSRLKTLSTHDSHTPPTLYPHPRFTSTTHTHTHGFHTGHEPIPDSRFPCRGYVMARHDPRWQSPGMAAGRCGPLWECNTCMLAALATWSQDVFHLLWTVPMRTCRVPRVYLRGRASCTSCDRVTSGECSVQYLCPANAVFNARLSPAHVLVGGGLMCSLGARSRTDGGGRSHRAAAGTSPTQSMKPLSSTFALRHVSGRNARFMLFFIKPGGPAKPSRSRPGTTR